MTASQEGFTDTVKKLQDLVEKLGTNVDVHEKTISKLTLNVVKEVMGKQELQIENQALTIATYQ